MIVRNDGSVSDVYRHDEAYRLPGESAAPTISMIPALWIAAKTEHIFYGNGIHINNIEIEYERVKYEINSYKGNHPKKKLFDNIPKPDVRNAVNRILRDDPNKNRH